MKHVENYYALLMAGGVGSRFWPVSTQEFPKQFHDMLGTGESLLQKTFKRLKGTVPEDQILVLTNTSYSELVQKQLPKIPHKNIVLEPAMRNTAPCILLSALKIEKENPDAIMIVAPSDAWIEDEQAFLEDLQKAFDAAQDDNAIVTLGVAPTFPNTGYGYIKYDKDDNAFAKAVNHFTEKPNYTTAKEFLKSGDYLWNAGMFICSVQTVLSSFKTFLPDMYRQLSEGRAFLNLEQEQNFVNEVYPTVENISIDFGIMEKHQNVKVVPASFDWNDLGTWGSLYDKITAGNEESAVINARVIETEASGNIVRTEQDKVVVIDGLKDYIIVENDEVLLIVPKSKEQDIKEIRNEVQRKFGKKLG